jgi:hypothetical protein
MKQVNIAIDTNDVQRMSREYFENIYYNKLKI